MNKYTYLLAVTTLLAAACADSNETEKPQAAAVERAAPMSKEERLAMRQKLMEERNVERAPVADERSATSGVIGEVPDELLDRIYADLEQKSKANRSEFTLLTAEFVRWPDGSLGCPEPGQVYTQAIVDGYRVVIEHTGRTYDYHASANGYFKICSGFRPSGEQNPTM